MNKIVLQSESDDCGMACIAMLAGCPYVKVRSEAEKIGYGRRGRYGLDTSQVKKLGEAVGLIMGYRCIPFVGLSNIPDTSLLAINYSEASGNWHWVVFKRESGDEYMLDPKGSLKKNRRTDFGKINIGWWLRVST